MSIGHFQNGGQKDFSAMVPTDFEKMHPCKISCLIERSKHAEPALYIRIDYGEKRSYTLFFDVTSWWVVVVVTIVVRC